MHLTLPSYAALADKEGMGNYALKRYYQWPHRIFYRQKLKMMVRMMGKRIYHTALDFGAGPGIFRRELEKHALAVNEMNEKDVMNLMARYSLITCGSVLEFIPNLSQVLRRMSTVLIHGGDLIVASPMDTRLTRFYFDLIGDRKKRHSHRTIVSAVSKEFKIVKYEEWFGLYFCLKAVKL